MEDLIREALLNDELFSSLPDDDQNHVVEVVAYTAEERIKSCNDHNAVMALYERRIK